MANEHGSFSTAPRGFHWKPWSDVTVYEVHYGRRCERIVVSVGDDATIFVAERSQYEKRQGRWRHVGEWNGDRRSISLNGLTVTTIDLLTRLAGEVLLRREARECLADLEDPYERTVARLSYLDRAAEHADARGDMAEADRLRDLRDAIGPRTRSGSFR